MRLLYVLFGLALLTSCGRKIELQEAYQLEDRGDNRNNNPTNDVYITTAYIGDAIDFITFQLDVDNRSDTSIIIDVADIGLLMDLGGTRRRYAKPVYKDDIMRYLTREADGLESERKSENTRTAILGGIDLLGGVLSGASAAETVIYGGVYATDMVDRSSRYKDAQRTVEEQIEYHEEYTLERAILEPGAKASFDIHFESPLVDAPAELEINCTNHTYDFDYQLEVIETRRRR